MRLVFIFIAALFIAGNASAQVIVKFNGNVDRQPIWGPSGYDHAEYYYLPDIETYYNVPQRRFFYFEQGRWIGASQLPSRFRGHDLFRSHKVVVNERTPYRNHVVYRDKYASFKGRHDQEPIRDSRDKKYFINKNHPEHSNWQKQQKQQKQEKEQQKQDNRGGKGKEKGRGGKH